MITTTVTEKIKCRTCGEEKSRIFAYITKCGRNMKRFKDESGSTWNGLRCPDCHKKNLRARMKVRTLSKRRTHP